MSPSIRLSLAAGIALLAGISCSDDSESGPTGPDPSEPEPALAVAASAPLVFIQVDAGLRHTCGVATDNRAFCWGSNKDWSVDGEPGRGQLGDGTVSDRRSPVAVAGGLRFRQVSAGLSHTCGITLDYRAYCWGANGSGRLGDGTTIDRRTPVRVAGGLQFRQVSAGYESTCAVRYTDNRAYCWGGNRYGQLGNGTTTTRLTPGPVSGTRQFRHVSSSMAYGHACGVTMSDQAFCWGNNRTRELGDSSTVLQRLVPGVVGGGRRFRQVEAGQNHSCGVTPDDRAFCWGGNIYGQLGNGTTNSSRRWPFPVAGSLRFREMSSGRYHNCAVTTTNLAYCWGSFHAGELGDGQTSTQRWVPVAVAGGHQFRQMAAGGSALVPEGQGHSCARDLTGKAYCWGDNTVGQIGDGTSTRRLVPRAVIGPM